VEGAGIFGPLDDYETVEVVMSEEQVGLIKVTKYEENEDGSANLEIETDREATRFLVEEGLLSLLQKCIDKENKDYALSPELQAERQLAEEINEGLDALSTDRMSEHTPHRKSE
jgi:hypothetical protein